MSKVKGKRLAHLDFFAVSIPITPPILIPLFRILSAESVLLSPRSS